MKKQSFVKGAIILMIANAISKILGAVFKIPLTYILQEEGMAIYNSAFGIYILFLSFIISGLPFAISKLVSEYNEKKEHNMVSAVISVSTALLLFIGFLGTIILYFGADFFALAMKEPRSVFAIKMIAPSVFFVALGCVYKNYFQGVSNMIPTAISQIVEALIKLCAGYMLAVYFIKTGTQAASGGATLGVSIGEALATLILFVFYIVLKKEHTRSSSLEKRVVLSKIGTIAIPLLFTSVISSMLSVMDTTLLRAKLIEYGHSIDEARFIYGAYSGYAL
ncbi:MAG: oligosaccharide flippase family protein, partial [Clostridia bacterium]|nr:oligosaccharide flippase family protein [Clostridia bacterium]